MPTRKTIAIAATLVAVGACAQTPPPPPPGQPGACIGGSGSAPAYVTAYSLTFENFPAPLMLDMEDRLVRFCGYRGHRQTESTGLTHRLWYESAIGSADLNRALVESAGVLGVRARVTMSGNDFRIQRVY